jgi:hypothetical protein
MNEGIAELRAEIAKLQAEIELLKNPSGIRAPSRGSAAPAYDGFGRAYSSDRIIDQLVTAANPGRLLAEGKIAGAPIGVKSWGDGGKSNGR